MLLPAHAVGGGSRRRRLRLKRAATTARRDVSLLSNDCVTAAKAENMWRTPSEGKRGWHQTPGRASARFEATATTTAMSAMTMTMTMAVATETATDSEVVVEAEAEEVIAGESATVSRAVAARLLPLSPAVSAGRHPS
jgi:hypothetical protein